MSASVSVSVFVSVSVRLPVTVQSVWSVVVYMMNRPLAARSAPWQEAAPSPWPLRLNGWHSDVEAVCEMALIVQLFVTTHIVFID